MSFDPANALAALIPATPAPPPISLSADPLLAIASAGGRTLPKTSAPQARSVVDAWCALSAEIGTRRANVAIFESKRAKMVCSRSHPQGEVWASDVVAIMIASACAGAGPLPATDLPE